MCIVLPSTPQYIFELLNNELYDYNKSILNKLCHDFNLDKKVVFDKYLEKKLNIIDDPKISIEITKKITNKKIPSVDDRCMARIWNRGKGGQCTRKKCNNNDYCLQHSITQKHGRIDENVPRNLFQNKSNALYKS